jgi:hemerythrin-like domain-containing protein
MKAMRIIHDEHHALSAVLHAMLHLVHDIRDRGDEPDFRLFGAMIYYIDAFPERFHHPKEDQYLFRFLRLRHPESAPLLDRLHGDHAVGSDRIRGLEQALSRYEHGGPAEFPDFLTAVESYAAFHRDHMRREEQEAFPLATKHLTAGDWDEIDAAFTGHADPMIGSDASTVYDRLFTRIVSMTPPPLGVGPSRARREN